MANQHANLKYNQLKAEGGDDRDTIRDRPEKTETLRNCLNMGRYGFRMRPLSCTKNEQFVDRSFICKQFLLGELGVFWTKKGGTMFLRSYKI